MRVIGGRSAADVFLLVKVVGAAVMGSGLAGAGLVIIGGVRLEAAVALALAVVLLCVLAVGWLQGRAGSAAPLRRRDPHDPYQGSYESRRPPNASPPQRPLAPSPRQPEAPAETSPAWYVNAARDSAQRSPSRTAAGAPPASQPLVLDDAESNGQPGSVEELHVPGRGGSVRRIVQCPRCADFGVDVWSERAGFSFVCRRCRHRWQWAPGNPWPPTVVRPAATHAAPPAGPA